MGFMTVETLVSSWATGPRLLENTRLTSAAQVPQVHVGYDIHLQSNGSEDRRGWFGVTVKRSST